jgi:hypothetical protein
MGGVEKNTPIDPMPMGARKDLGRVCPPLSKHALPAEYFTIECRMVEQKKPPLTNLLESQWGLGW